MVYLMLILGFVLLVIGGDRLVSGAVGIAKKMKVSSLMIGLTLVGFGTSTPELVTSLRAAMIGSEGISVGNVVGSNIANILLVLGSAALIYDVNSERKHYIRDSIMLIIATATFIIACFIGVIDRVYGIILLFLLIGYIIYTYKTEKEVVLEDKFVSERSMFLSILITIIGIAMTIIGADILVKSAVEIARSVGISETVIGLTVVAVGTSLPELAATVMAAIKRENGVALGNVIGSNIYNLLFILGATGMILPVRIPVEIINTDLWVMLAVTIALVFYTFAGKVIGRLTGGLFLLTYFCYVFYLAKIM